MGDAPGIVHRLQAGAARGLLGLLSLLPYERRIRLAGRIFSSVVAPLAGWRRRIRANLDHAWPDLPEPERRRIVAQVPDGVGRMLAEVWSGAEFRRRVADTPLEGPGLEALDAAIAAKRPVMMVTAHFGNYDALRVAMTARGHDTGAIYKPMSNPAFNPVYVEVLSGVGGKLFPTTRAGITEFLRHLERGGMGGVVTDVASRKAPVLRFFGRPAHTPLSAAEWAMDFDAPMFPVFGLRRPDGLTFRLIVERPLDGATPEARMQQMNDVTERMVRAHPEQWFWIHNRWKGQQPRRT